MLNLEFSFVSPAEIKLPMSLSEDIVHCLDQNISHFH